MSTRRTSGRTRTKVAKAALISRPVLALRTWMSNPIERAADCASLNVVAELGPVGLTSMAKRVVAGTSSRAKLSRFAINSPLRKLIPVRLPLGRAKLATSPLFTGSSAAMKTIGIGMVAALAASVAIRKCDDHRNLAANQIGRQLW